MRRSTALVITGTLLLIAAVVLVIALQSSDDVIDNTNLVVPTGTTVENSNSATNIDPPRELTEEEKQRVEVNRIATIFTEQYGTYIGGFGDVNVHALESIVTQSLYKQLESLAANQVESAIQITTQVIGVDVITFTQNNASVVSVNTLRQEDADTSVILQELALQLVYKDSEWIVESVQWKEPTQADVL